jgi:hypothetical protein
MLPPVCSVRLRVPPILGTSEQQIGERAVFDDAQLSEIRVARTGQAQGDLALAIATVPKRCAGEAAPIRKAHAAAAD